MAIREPDPAADLGRRQVQSLAEAALRRAGVEGIVPTPLEAVATAAGIREIIDTDALPTIVANAKPSAWKRILGAIVFPQRVVYVDLSQSEGRRRLTEAHEIGHRIIPWHEASFLLDQESSLMAQTRDRLESEAYLAGSHLIYQGHRFMEVALDYKVTIATPIALSTQYRASIHATLRYYVENHPDEVALIVTGRFQFQSGELPVWYCIESARYVRRFGQIADAVGSTVAVKGGTGQPFGDIVNQARIEGGVVAKPLSVRSLCGEFEPFTAEAFYNRHNLFIMLSSTGSRRFGRRVRVSTSRAQQ